MSRSAWNMWTASSRSSAGKKSWRRSRSRTLKEKIPNTIAPYHLVLKVKVTFDRLEGYKSNQLGIFVCVKVRWCLAVVSL